MLRHDTARASPLVVDPVLVAKGGASLLESSAMRALESTLIGRADLVTPNIPEAERLTGLDIATVDDMAHAAGRIHELGPPGGPGEGRSPGVGRDHRPAQSCGRDRALHCTEDREPPHPRHRLHPGLGHRHGNRAGVGAGRFRRAGAPLPESGNRDGAWPGRRPWAGQPRGDGDAHDINAASGRNYRVAGRLRAS